MVLCMTLTSGCAEKDGTKKDARGISGSRYTDLTSALESSGFPEHEAKNNEDKRCQAISATGMLDNNTGIHYIYAMSYTYNDEIMKASFDTVNLSYVDNDTFLSESERYLDFILTAMKYDECDIEETKKWLSENIKRVNRGEYSAEIVVGDVKFNLYGSDLEDGTCGARTLILEKEF